MRIDPSCIFCRIVAGEIPSELLYQNELVIAFPDIHPQAPVHILVTPRDHIPSLNDLRDDDNAISSALLFAAQRVARDAGLANDGYRVSMNTGAWGGQSVFHIHAHVLGGRQLGALG